MVNRWLLKTEPRDYSFSDLVRDGQTVWDGVRAPLALKNIALMREGDPVFIYHTGKGPSIVGTAEVTRGPYQDPGEKDPRFLVVEVKAAGPLQRPVPLRELKEKGFPPEWELLRLPRLSVVPVSLKDWKKIIDLSKQK